MYIYTPGTHSRAASFGPILGHWNFLRCHQASAEKDAATGPLRTGARQAGLLTALCRPPAPHTGGRSQESLPHQASPWNRTGGVGKLEVLCLATILSRRLQYPITLPGTWRTPIYPKGAGVARSVCPQHPSVTRQTFSGGQLHVLWVGL